MQPRFRFAYVLLLCVFILSCSDDEPTSDGCGDDRYGMEVFSNIDVQTVKYGQNLNVNGTAVELFADVYQPAGDTASKRPLVIWAFGGAFVTGERQDMDEYARFMARRGYVSATIDYRILGFTGIPDSLEALDIAIKAMGDMKAAVRFFKQDAATDDLFRIDAERIFLGGVSAGAITALHAAMVQADDTLEPHVAEAVAQNGGIEGSSGDAAGLSFSSKVAGVVNLSGAIYRLDWIDADDPPIISLHGVVDEVVKFEHDFAMVGGQPIVRLFGSGSIHPHATSIGLTNELFAVEGGTHVNIYISSNFEDTRNEFNDRMLNFLIDIICE